MAFNYRYFNAAHSLGPTPMKRQNFPPQFQKLLDSHQSSLTHLAKAMERRGYRLSKQFLCQIGTGARAVPSLQLRRICETLMVSDEERKALNLAACRDNGFYV